jgi:hypothetical protein
MIKLYIKKKKDVLFLLLIITSSSSWLNKIRWTFQMCIPFKVYSHLVLGTLVI